MRNKTLSRIIWGVQLAALTADAALTIAAIVGVLRSRRK